MEGVVWKQGDKFSTKWRKRLLKLVDAQLLYFKEDSLKKPLGSIDLAKAESVSRSSKAEKQKFGFQIVTSDRTWYLSCSTTDERDTWLNVIAKTTGLALEEPNSLGKRESYNEAQLSTGSATPLSTSMESESTFGEQNSQGKALYNLHNAIISTAQDEIEHNGLNQSDSLDYDQTVEQMLMNLGGVSPMFELEEEVQVKKPKYLPQIGDIERSARSTNRRTSKEILDPFLLRGAHSLPVDIPKHLVNWKRDNTQEQEAEKTDTDQQGFVKPHILAAQTYQEHYMNRFGRFFDVPLSQTRKVKAVM